MALITRETTVIRVMVHAATSLLWRKNKKQRLHGKYSAKDFTDPTRRHIWSKVKDGKQSEMLHKAWKSTALLIRTKQSVQELLESLLWALSIVMSTDKKCQEGTVVPVKVGNEVIKNMVSP